MNRGAKAAGTRPLTQATSLQRRSRACAGSRHGSWYIGLDLQAALDARRRRVRRGGYPSRKAAAAVLATLYGPRSGDPGRQVVTTGDWLAHWLVARTSPATSTMRGYAAHVRLYLAPCLGRVLLTGLPAARGQAMFTAIVRQHQALGSPVPAATLNRIRATLRAALNAAVRRGLIAEALLTVLRDALTGSRWMPPIPEPP